MAFSYSPGFPYYSPTHRFAKSFIPSRDVLVTAFAREFPDTDTDALIPENATFGFSPDLSLSALYASSLREGRTFEEMAEVRNLPAEVAEDIDAIRSSLILAATRFNLDVDIDALVAIYPGNKGASRNYPTTHYILWMTKNGISLSEIANLMQKRSEVIRGQYPLLSEVIAAQ